MSKYDEKGFDQARYATVRRDVLHMLTNVPMDVLSSTDRYVFLIINNETMGGAWTSIDRESIKKRWGIHPSTVTESVRKLEDMGFIITKDIKKNGTQQKFVAKYVGTDGDGDLCFMGYEMMSKQSLKQPDVIRYPEECLTDTEALASRKLPSSMATGVSLRATPASSQQTHASSETMGASSETPGVSSEARGSSSEARGSSSEARGSSFVATTSSSEARGSSSEARGGSSRTTLTRKELRKNEKREEGEQNLSLTFLSNQDAPINKAGKEDLVSLIKKKFSGSTIASQDMNNPKDDGKFESVIKAFDGDRELMANAVDLVEIPRDGYFSEYYHRFIDAKAVLARSGRDKFINEMKKLNPHDFSYESITGRPEPEEWTDEHSQCYLMMAKSGNKEGLIALNMFIKNTYFAFDIARMLDKHLK